MRLWHYELIPYLPKDMLVSQWRECIAIKRQWEKGTLKHRLVSYVMDYDKGSLFWYLNIVCMEMDSRNINYRDKYYDEIHDWCDGYVGEPYKEHNERYLTQCFYNLEEKYDRGIISEEEWIPIESFYYRSF